MGPETIFGNRERKAFQQTAGRRVTAIDIHQIGNGLEYNERDPDRDDQMSDADQVCVRQSVDPLAYK